MTPSSGWVARRLITPPAFTTAPGMTPGSIAISLRFTADTGALKEIATHYETSGKLRVPLAMLYTLGDPIVPYWNEVLYQMKVSNMGAEHLLMSDPVSRYGHASVNMFRGSLVFSEISAREQRPSAHCRRILMRFQDIGFRNQRMSGWRTYARYFPSRLPHALPHPPTPSPSG